MGMSIRDILSNLKRLGEILGDSSGQRVEILLIGGAAGILTHQLDSARTTQDCDVIRYSPPNAQQAVLDAAKKVAKERSLPENWLNSQAMPLDILPDGWDIRNVPIGEFDSLSVFALSRLDILATKFYAAYPRDIQDIASMNPTSEELDFVGTYLNMLRVPSRQANLDQVARSIKLLSAFQEPEDA